MKLFFWFATQSWHLSAVFAPWISKETKGTSFFPSLSIAQFLAFVNTLLLSSFYTEDCDCEGYFNGQYIGEKMVFWYSFTAPLPQWRSKSDSSPCSAICNSNSSKSEKVRKWKVQSPLPPNSEAVAVDRARGEVRLVYPELPFNWLQAPGPTKSAKWWFPLSGSCLGAWEHNNSILPYNPGIIFKMKSGSIVLPNKPL